MLDNLGHELLSDFVHIAAFHTTDPARVLDGDTQRVRTIAWGHTTGKKRRAQAATEKLRNREPEASLKTEQTVPLHVWKARLHFPFSSARMYSTFPSLPQSQKIRGLYINLISSSLKEGTNANLPR